jgi:hypothetical protein
MIYAIVLGFITGIIVMIVKIKIMASKKRAVEKAWNSCNCQIDKVIYQLKQKKQDKEQSAIILIKKYDDSFLDKELNIAEYVDPRYEAIRSFESFKNKNSENKEMCSDLIYV